MKITAKEACKLMVHKDDIMFGVRERVYHEIYAAALKGECGVSISYPAEYDGYWETEAFMQELIEDGYQIIDVGVIGLMGQHVCQIYWAV